jgi:hypothetical protein
MNDKKGILHMKWANDPLARHSLAFREIWVMDQGDAGATMYVSRRGIAALAISMAVLTINGEAQGSETAITCANPASGASWQIKIDYDRRTVDSNPARISDAKISWRDRTDGGNYTLDRKSGNLTVIVASSTGGYFLYDRCRLEN